MSARSTFPYVAPILLGAFLLFQVQLLIAKYILPWFGGTPSVWTTCMLVFQMLLLAGYLYAHLLSIKLALRTQVKLHMILMIISIAIMAGYAFYWPSPITPSAEFAPGYSNQPIWQIVRLLVVSIGLPFFLLSSTSPLLQRWFATVHGRQPYRLYALSNTGSLLGLLSYPFLLEPNLTLNRQAWLWSGCYLAFVAMCVICTPREKRIESQPATQPVPAPLEEESSPEPGRLMLWLLLAACACTMFLATTNMICQEIAVIPFLWVLPLGLYLISFIACFDSSRWYRRVVFHPLYFVSFILLSLSGNAKVLPQIGSHLLMLFVVAMICHGELVRIKPASRYLTSFYLMIAGGGALGGIFVTLIAPLIFPAFWEFQLAILGCGLMAALILYRDRHSWFHHGSRWLPFLLVLGMAAAIEFAAPRIPGLGTWLPAKIYSRVFFGILAMAAIWKGWKCPILGNCTRWIQSFALGLLVFLGYVCVGQAQFQVRNSSLRFRSFFGAFRIEQNGTSHALKHGQTMHGWQIRDGDHDPTPTSYYATNTGIGVLLWNHPKKMISGPGSDLRVGIVGLGVGTLAAYGRVQDYYRFYEIDPAILRLSEGDQPRFSFLKITAAKVDVVLGDARQSLAREAALGEFQKFDVLVLDAFSSDSIPIHLLTREAMQLYLRHMRGPESVIAFHISNRILDLAPVLRRLSRDFNLDLVIYDSPSGPVSSAATWGMLCRDNKLLHFPKLERRARSNIADAPTIVWTDGFSNLFRLVKKGAWW